jgi:hypothetical protein
VTAFPQTGLRTGQRRPPASWLGQQARRWWYRHFPPRDPWHRVEIPVDFRLLARGAPASFLAFFERECPLRLPNLEAVCDWLHACRFDSDRSQFGVSEHWQHPADFEARRCGDCEDHALWAWRKLVGLGLDAEFVMGRCNPAPETRWCNHAWLHVHIGPKLVILETTATRRQAMIVPWDQARHSHLPTASIDHEFRTYAFANYFHVLATFRAMAVPHTSATPLTP